MSIARRMIWATLSCVVLGVFVTGAVLWTQGYRVYVIHTGSMSPAYKPGDVVVDRPAQHHYRAGEVITFRHSATANDVVTHRITDITATGLIHTKGDANRTADVWDIRPDQVRGSVAFGISHAGYLLVFLRQPAGAASLACAVLAVMMLWKCFFPGDDEHPVDTAQAADRADTMTLTLVADAVTALRANKPIPSGARHRADARARLDRLDKPRLADIAGPVAMTSGTDTADAGLSILA